jgi:hypothetical protein
MNIDDLVSTPSDINEHLRLLAELATGLDVVEIGFRTGISSRAILSTCRSLHSIDIADCDIGELADNPKFRFTKGNSKNFDIGVCDMLFIDGDHSYEGVRTDLSKSFRVTKMIALHDTDGKKFPGVRKAVFEFLDQNPHWMLLHDRLFNHGLMVIARRR